ncbi:hypothetical protein Golob_025298, partial [Gossypium lobatum]|nr:hypothetical protein [Gossypium lobatum]
MDDDVKAIAEGIRNYLRIRVKIDIRQSRKRKKKLIAGREEGASFKIGYFIESSTMAGGSGENEGENDGKKMFGSNLMRNDRANLRLNLYGKSKQILNDEGCKSDLMEVGLSEENQPIIVREGKKRPRPNNDSVGSPNEELRWKNEVKKGQIIQTAEPAGQTNVERSRMERIRRKYGVNGFDVSAQGSR